MKNRLIVFLLSLAASGVVFVGTANAVELQLANGWTEYTTSTGNPEVFLDKGIVRFKGAIANGASSYAFNLHG